MISKITSFIYSIFSILLLFTGCQPNERKQERPVNREAVETSVERMKEKPVYPYGGVYFRKSNPPKEDWASDHKTAADLGANTFRHWFMWSVIEVEPGVYDWEDYDQQMDLAAEHGLKVIIGEISNGAPEWMYDKYPHARRKGSDDLAHTIGMSGSAVTSSAPMCLDNEEIIHAAENFQTALIKRYRDHPALLGYDLWNEMHYNECYCEATQQKFREWLKEKYGTLDAVEKAWHRYSIGNWENLHPSYQSFGGYPDAIDWVEFGSDNKYRLLHRRVELFKRLDKKNLITGHSAFVARAASITRPTYNDWRDAKEFDIFGFTYVSSRNGNEPWMLFTSVDFVRAASRDKPFWHAEAEAGSMWMQPQVVGRAREDGRISDPKDVRFWNQVSMAGGATGILYPRWRPLLDGPLWAAFGPMNLDGSVGPKAEMAGKVARWANENPAIWKSKPVQGEIGIIWLEDAMIFNSVKFGSTQHYAEATRGAYQGFFDNNIQADYVHIDHIDEYPVVYLPYPVMLKQQVADQLITYVENGGKLICEGLPGYFGDGGHVGEVQPNLGLDKLFGAREKYVEFTPDLLEELTLQVRGNKVNGRFFLQEYLAEGGTVVGHFDNGATAAIDHTYGQGKTLLIGTYPGAGYFQHHSEGTKKFFADLLDWAEVNQRVISNHPEVKARLHQGEGGTYLWVLNPSRSPKKVTIFLQADDILLNEAKDIWADTPINIIENQLTMTVGDRDAAVLQLK